jgi:hypothetical protein
LPVNDPTAEGTAEGSRYLRELVEPIVVNADVQVYTVFPVAAAINSKQGLPCSATAPQREYVQEVINFGPGKGVQEVIKARFGEPIKFAPDVGLKEFLLYRWVAVN